MNVVAYTKLDQSYPGFINFTPNDDGGVTIHLRGDPQLVAGVGTLEGPSASLVLSADEWRSLREQLAL